MPSPPYSLNHLLFAVLPYAAAAVFIVVVVARRFRVPPFGTPPQPAPRHHPERFLFRYGIIVILAGHLVAFLIPEQVLLWNENTLRLYVLEVSALIFAFLTLVGLLMTVARCWFSAEARQTVRLSDWLLYALLLVQVASGICLALLYPSGSSWYATLVTPYLRSLVRFEPDASLVGWLPHLFQLHLVSAWVLLLLLPFTRVVRPLILSSREGEAPVEPGTRGRVLTAVLLVALTCSVLPLIPRLGSAHLPGNQQGYEPVQPIAFSHRLHAGELGMSCLACHDNAEKGRHAGIPSANVCMNCHRYVTAPTRDFLAEAKLAKEEKRLPRTIISPELAKLYTALGVDDKMQPDPAKRVSPIRWIKVHNLPSFTRFDHGAHVNAGMDCQRCHGLVERMERVRQVEDLSMGWCVQCHREAREYGVAGRAVRPSVDCTACHH
jgi:respiratory nitrate reductase gamma subunit